MPPTGNHGQLHIVHGIDQSVHIVNSPRPIARQIAQQRLGFAQPLKGVLPRGIDQQVDSLEGLFVLPLSVRVISPSMRGEGNPSAYVDLPNALAGRFVLLASVD